MCSGVLYDDFRVHSTASKCVYLPVKHELEVSNPSSNIQTKYTEIEVAVIVKMYTVLL